MTAIGTLGEMGRCTELPLPDTSSDDLQISKDSIVKRLISIVQKTKEPSKVILAWIGNVFKYFDFLVLKYFDWWITNSNQSRKKFPSDFLLENDNDNERQWCFLLRSHRWIFDWIFRILFRKPFHTRNSRSADIHFVYSRPRNSIVLVVVWSYDLCWLVVFSDVVRIVGERESCLGAGFVLYRRGGLPTQTSAYGRNVGMCSGWCKFILYSSFLCGIVPYPLPKTSPSPKTYHDVMGSL